MTTIAREKIGEPPLPLIDVTRHAFFFDVDGTLAELCAEPDAVSIPAEVRTNLELLSKAAEGALALVSGRPISQLDNLVAPLKFPLAGIHGAERRDSAGNVHRLTLPRDVAEPLQRLLEQEMAAMPGTLLEAKGAAFALHYRQAMHFQHQIRTLAESVSTQFPQLSLQPGKCVVELKLQGVEKGAAISAFMRETPFIGRVPVFLGDDLTDENGFLAVNAMQGISVKVGEGSSQSRYRLQQVVDVYQWLEKLLLQSKQKNVDEELGYESSTSRI